MADAVLCAGGPVRALAALSLAPEHRRGHGALYDAVNSGRIEITRLRRCLADLPLPPAPDGRPTRPWTRATGCGPVRPPPGPAVLPCLRAYTPLLTSRLLSEQTGSNIRLKAEIFQRTGSYKLRGPLNKIPQLSDEQKKRGVICRPETTRRASPWPRRFTDSARWW